MNELTNLHATLGTTRIRIWPRFGNLQLVRIPAGGGRVTNLIERYKSSGKVEYAEPDYFGSIAAHNNPNDASYGSLWGMLTSITSIRQPMMRITSFPWWRPP
jgi:hypothetical protein